jgi:hypothetical protein
MHRRNALSRTENECFNANNPKHGDGFLFIDYQTKRKETSVSKIGRFPIDAARSAKLQRD